MNNFKIAAALALVAVFMFLVACGNVESSINQTTTAEVTMTEVEATTIIPEPTTSLAEKTTLIEPTMIIPPTTIIAEKTTTAAEQTTSIAEQTTSISEQTTTSQIEVIEEEVLRNPLTNEVIASLEDLPVRPVVVAIGNNSGARPQSGLAYADIVYEVPAEGGVSRYLGVFYSEQCDKIGPCRSARPYIVRIAAQYNAALAHVGGSMEALEMLDNKIVPDIDEFAYASTFWRSKDRKAPNNCYTSTEKLLNWYAKRDYTIQRIPQGFSFLKEDETVSGEDISQITVNYISAKNRYEYNAEDELYYRFISNSQQVDPNGNINICCSNVIIQYVKSVVLDDEGRLAIDLYAGGDAQFFIKGKMISGTWEREDESASTVFYDADGNEVKFATGKTWIQIVDQTCKVSYE